MNNKTNSSKDARVSSQELAAKLIQSNRYNSKEKKCVKSLKYAALVAAMLASSACTGPFGMVLGGADVHESYNRRQKIQLGIENLNDRDRAELDQLIGSVK